MSDPHRPRSDHPKRTYFPDDLGFGGPPDAVDSFFRIRGSSGPPGSTMKTAVWTRTAPPPRRIQSSDASSKRPVTAPGSPNEGSPGPLDSRRDGSRAWSAGTTCRRRRSSGPSPTAATCRCSISSRRGTASASSSTTRRTVRARSPGRTRLEALLQEYLSMVVEMRSGRPVTAPSLRHEDLVELAASLGDTPESIEAAAGRAARRRHRRRRRDPLHDPALDGGEFDALSGGIPSPGGRRRRLHRESRGAAPPRSA